jgi:F-type H+-transporting ATPase subunit delta
MVELATLARPYAEAIFRLARQNNTLASWSDQLAMGADIVSDARMQVLIANPNISLDKVVEVVLSIAGRALDDPGGNLIRVLAENDRLALLPEIRNQYSALRAETEGVLEASVITAMALNKGQLDDLVASLRSKFSREVKVEVQVDPGLIGGAVIKLGDRVIDGSVRGRLQKMAATLS